MERNRVNVNTYLNELRDAGEYFVGPNVHREVARCNNPDAWEETLQRYVELAKTGVAGDAAIAYSQFYLDLCVTVLTRKIVTVDIHHIVGADVPRQNKETSDMRIIHAIMFKKTLARVLVCACECLLGRLPPDDGVTNLTSILYDRVKYMLKERFYKNDEDGKYYARERLDLTAIVHSLVRNWLIDEVLPKLSIQGTRNDDAIALADVLRNTKMLSSNMSFFAVSHCYWLWLHLTAAGLQTKTAQTDFLTMFYAFDLFVYCPQCSAHFVQHRTALYTRQPYTVSVRTSHTAQSIVYDMHNVVNRETGKDVLSPVVMTDYVGYWERYRLFQAGN